MSAVTETCVRTRADLLAILPRPVAATVEEFLFWTPEAYAALRLLALLDSTTWQLAVAWNRIDPWTVLAYAKALPETKRDRVLAEIACGFFLTDDVRVPVAATLLRLDEDSDFAAVLDALRIAREGLES